MDGYFVMSLCNGDRHPLRVLHVASFSGNIGDNANHMGFRPWFQEIVGRPVEWTNLEIREFYWKERLWDKSFVSIANAHDLLIIGGGNYFELWVDNSPTGTSVAIEPETFAKIQVPVLFNALGVDPGQGVPDVSLKRFSNFLDILLSDSRYLVTVRNDGALDNLEKYLGVVRAEKTLRVPDSGFFCPQPIASSQPSGRKRIAINLANDMPDVRFSGFAEADGQDGFCKELANMMNTLTTRFEQLDFVFQPHIFRDLEIISRVIHFMNDRHRRTRVVVGAYGSGDMAALAALSIYRSSDVVLGMRFHANVCPIGMGVETFGLANYPQITQLYAELGQSHRAVDVTKPCFGQELVTKIETVLSDGRAVGAWSVDKAISGVVELRENFAQHLGPWLEANNLK